MQFEPGVFGRLEIATLLALGRQQLIELLAGEPFIDARIGERAIEFNQ
jgi:hypothetical protein